MTQNYEQYEVPNGVPVKMWTTGVPVEEDARKQLHNIARLPIVFKHVAVMPDVHLGIGATIGSVVPTIKAIIPAAVGVDLGCGMMACKTTLTANNWNVVQYSALLMMFAQVSGLEPGELVHVISDMHIYDRHIDMVKTMLDREPLPAPKVRLNPEVKNFYDFTVDDFIVEDYEYGKSMGRVPVAI